LKGKVQTHNTSVYEKILIRLMKGGGTDNPSPLCLEDQAQYLNSWATS
jgi:hypothetical protein